MLLIGRVRETVKKEMGKRRFLSNYHKVILFS
jgi:hypothetical protein